MFSEHKYGLPSPKEYRALT